MRARTAVLAAALFALVVVAAAFARRARTTGASIATGASTATPTAPVRARGAGAWPVRSELPTPASSPVRPPTLAEAFARRPGVCFALSANRRRAACALGTWSNQTGSALTVSIIGDVGTARSEWTYHDRTGYADDGGDPAEPSAPDELAAALRALADRKYVAAIEPRVALANNTTVAVGAWKFRRGRLQTHAVTPWKQGDGPETCCDNNVYEEHVEVKCGEQWARVDVENVRYDEPAIAIWKLDDRVAIVELDASWGIEGEHGGQRSATAVDVAAACAGRY